MSNRNSSILGFVPAVGWGLVVSYFSLIPGTEVPSIVGLAEDFVLHFVIYAGFGLLLVFGANGFSKRKVSVRFLLSALLLLWVFGLAIEVAQEDYVDGRHFEWADLLFNTLGSLLIVPLNRLLKPPQTVRPSP